MRELPTIQEPVPVLNLSEGEIAELSDEVRALAAERDAVILAHNYQVPEIQDVADYVGDSLGLSRQAADADAEVIAEQGPALIEVGHVGTGENEAQGIAEGIAGQVDLRREACFRTSHCLRELATGRSNAATAKALFMSERAVEKHVGSVFQKLGLLNEADVNRRVMAVLAYLEATGGPTSG